MLNKGSSPWFRIPVMLLFGCAVVLGASNINAAQNRPPDRSPAAPAAAPATAAPTTPAAVPAPTTAPAEAGTASGEIAASAAPGFSIIAVEPQAEDQQVLIRFNRPVAKDELEDHLRVFPYAGIHWHLSNQVEPTVILLKGSFRPGQRYALSLPEDFAVAGVHYRRQVDSFLMPDRAPRVSFTEPGTVIERDSRQMLHLKTVNCSRVQVKALNVPPLLLPEAMALADYAGPINWTTLLDEIQARAGKLRTLAGREPSLEPYLKPLDQERQVLATQTGKNREQIFSLPLTFRAHPDQGAIQLIALDSLDTDPPAPPICRLFRITDLGLSAKIAASSLLVWSTSLRTGQPQPEVSILALTEAREIFPIGRTDAQGVLLVQDRNQAQALVTNDNSDYRFDQRSFQIAKVRFLIAVTATDSSFIALDPKQPLKPEGITVKPGKWQGRPLSQGAIFTERGIYRPGETVHFKAFQRRYQDGRIFAPDGRVTVHIRNPKDEEIYRKELPLTAFGSAWDDCLIEGFQPLGTYTATVENADDPAGTDSTTFQVEEFRPPRHFARIAFEPAERTSGAYVNLNRTEPLVRIAVSGQYYAGGPVKNAQARWKIHYTSVSRAVEGWEEYDFGYQSDEEPELIESGEALLDQEGRMTLDFPLDDDLVAGKRALEVSATVLDFDGRAGTNRGTYQSDPDFLVGIGSHSGSVRVDTPQRLTLVVLDKDRHPLDRGRIEASVLSRGGTYVRTRNEQGNVDWDYREIWRRQYGADVELEGGRGEFKCAFAVGGSYLVSFTYRDRQGRPFSSAVQFQVTGDPFWTAYENRERPFDELQLDADRHVYQPGTTATVTAAGGRPITAALLTLEQGELVSYRVLTGTDLKQPITIPITEQHLPNLFVSVLALTPRGEFPLYTGRYDAEAPGFLFGTLNLPVRREPGDLMVTIAADREDLKALPGGDVQFDLRVTDENRAGVKAELAVAVINEAVLALTGFTTPDLTELRSFDGPLGVITQELRSLLLKQTPFHDLRVDPLTGGGGAELGLPATDVRKDFRPVAYFNPAVPSDAEGRARVNFKLPDTMTQYRIYVVAADPGSRFGSAVNHLQVSKPFYLEPGLPSFFHTGDRFRFPIQAFNRSDRAGDGELRLEASAQLQLSPPGPPQPLAKDGSGRFWVSGLAAAAGAGEILAAGRLGELTDAVRLEIPIEDPTPLGTEVCQGSFRRTLTLNPAAGAAWPDLLKSREGGERLQATLEISASPLLQLTGALHYLLDYPYGCIEQTSSGVLALAGLRALIETGAIPGFGPDAMDRFLKRGVNRILAMQTDSGGFGYWPGYETPHPWGSLYAAAALALSRQNGFPVALEPLRRALDFLQKGLADRKEALLYRMFSAYVLKLFGERKAADGNTLSLPPLADFAALDNLTRILRLLAEPGKTSVTEADLTACIDRAEAGLGRPEGYEIFNARYLEPALALLLALDTGPAHAAAADRAARILLDAVGKRGIWSSSSDTGWALLALGRYFNRRAESAAPLTVTLDQPGSNHAIAAADPKKIHSIALDGPALLEHPELKLTSPSDQEIYYRLNISFPRLDYAKAGHDGGLKVWKKIENMDGIDTVRVGDIVRVTVGVDTRDADRRFVILDDPLPAGLVAINSALATEEPVADDQAFDRYRGSFWNPDGSFRFQPNFFEIRDRRVLAFRDTLWKGAYQFTYYARAVCEGSFVLPSTKAELMYQPEVNGFSPAAALTIEAAGDR